MSNDKETLPKEKMTEEQDRFRQENYKATREGEYMYLQAIPLSVIGDRAHGEKSINGVRADEKGPMTKDKLNQIVDTASQKGITMTCKEMKIGYDTTPTTGCTRSSWSELTSGSSRSSQSTAAHSTPVDMLDMGLNMHCRRNPIRTEFNWRTGRRPTATTSTRPCGTTLDEREVWERTSGGRKDDVFRTQM